MKNPIDTKPTGLRKLPKHLLKQVTSTQLNDEEIDKIQKLVDGIIQAYNEEFPNCGNCGKNISTIPTDILLKINALLRDLFNLGYYISDTVSFYHKDYEEGE